MLTLLGERTLGKFADKRQMIHLLLRRLHNHPDPRSNEDGMHQAEHRSHRIRTGQRFKGRRNYHVDDEPNDK